MEQVAVKPTITLGVIVVTLLLILVTVLSQNIAPSIPEDEDQTPASALQLEEVNFTIANPTPIAVANNTIKANPPPEPKNNNRNNNYAATYNPIVQQPVFEQSAQQVLEPKILVNESFLLSAIKALGTNGGQIILENDLAILGRDVFIPSNITLIGASPEVTIFLVGKNLGVAEKATNVTLKDLTVDASALGERYAFVIRENATNVQLDNVKIRNYAGSSGVIFVLGDNVLLNNLSFSNVNNKPILISGSNISVSNCISKDNSKWPLVAIVGGLSNITVSGNTALNRPLLTANYGNTTKNILIENNTLLFPNATYGLIISGGFGNGTKSPHENVTIRGNSITAAPGAWNAVAIYGLTRNALVTNNTIDMTSSAHNGIGVSSGVNVIVSGNTVFGCTESTEGGIEVESNPEHNRFVGFSENVTVISNTVYNSKWGIYVRVMQPSHPNWNGTVLLSKNIVLENNTVFDCNVGVNLLQGDTIIVRNNNIASNSIPFSVDPTRVFNYTVTGNLGYS